MRSNRKLTPRFSGRSCARAFLLLYLAACGSVGPASSEVPFDNRGGVLYLTLAPELQYDADSARSRFGKYCGKSGTPLPAEAITEGSVGETPQIAYLVATWPAEAHPEIGAVSFGLKYPKGIEIIGWHVCEQTLSAPTNDWPMSGEGITMARAASSRDTSRTVELAWLVIVAHKPGIIELTPHPNPIFGAHFATMTDPKEAPIAGLGELGFGMPGNAPEPFFPGPPMGAACVQDSLCVRISIGEAEYYGSGATWLGEEVYCTSLLCRPEAPTGACCLQDGACRRMTLQACMKSHGKYQGDGSRCEDQPCPNASGGSGQGSGH